MKKTYWIIFGGLNFAGMTAENNAEIFYGTERQAGIAAYDLACENYEMYEGGNGIPYATDDEDLIGTEDDEGNSYVSLEEREDLLDYYYKPVTDEELTNSGLHQDLDQMIKFNKHNKEEIYKELGL